MKTYTKQELLQMISEHMQINAVAPLRLGHVENALHSVLQDIFPEYYRPYRIEQQVDTIVPPDFSIDLPTFAETVASVEVYVTGTYEDTSVELPIRMYDVWIENMAGQKRLHFNTCGWRGKLVVTGEARLSIENDELTIPNPDPIVLLTCHRLQESMAKRIAQTGDPQRYRIATDQAMRDYQMGQKALRRNCMARMTSRRNISKADYLREAKARFALFNNLEIK